MKLLDRVMGALGKVVGYDSVAAAASRDLVAQANQRLDRAVDRLDRSMKANGDDAFGQMIVGMREGPKGKARKKKRCPTRPS